MIECELCSQQFETQVLFSSHLRHKHNTKYQKYYDDFLKGESEGECLVCRKDTKFERGRYRDYCCVSCMIKSSEIHAKTKATSIERYGGAGLAAYSIIEKARQTNIKKYGFENPYLFEDTKRKAHSKEALAKYRETMVSKYGVEHPMLMDKNKKKFAEVTHTKEVNKKRRESVRKHNLDTYGVEHNFQRPDVIESIKETRSNRKKNFCEENECTPLTALIEMYQTGWSQSDLELEYVFDGNTKYIKNYEIDKIKQYADNSIISHSEAMLS